MLDLVTQTRLDACEDKWREVCAGYERIVAIFKDHLAEKHELRDACINNIEMAYSKTSELEKAQEMYAKALAELEYGARADCTNFMSCLNITINHLEHRRLFFSDFDLS